MEMIPDTDPQAAFTLAMEAWKGDVATALLPVIALVLWTLVMWLWLYATRIPAMQKAKVNPQEFADKPEEARGRLTKGAIRAAQNYNHLHEQPTIFYATAIALAMIAPGDTIGHYLAWGYVGLRVLHSLVHATVNIIIVRFLLFTLSSIVLVALAVVTLMKLLAV